MTTWDWSGGEMEEDDGWAAGTWGTEALRRDISIMGWVGGRRLMQRTGG